MTTIGTAIATANKAANANPPRSPTRHLQVTAHDRRPLFFLQKHRHHSPNMQLSKNIYRLFSLSSGGIIDGGGGGGGGVATGEVGITKR